MTLTGEGQYNINALKEIEATDSFLSLDDETRGCRISDESHDDCTTRLYMDNMRQKCGCLPFSIASQEEVVLELCSTRDTETNGRFSVFFLIRIQLAPRLNL